MAGGTFVRAGVGNWLSLEVARDADQVEASGLPPGMGTDSRSGLISGAPTAVGDYNISVAASNRFGIVNGSLSFAWPLWWLGEPIPTADQYSGRPGRSVNAPRETFTFWRYAPMGGWELGQQHLWADKRSGQRQQCGGRRRRRGTGGALRSDGVVVGWGKWLRQMTIPGGLSRWPSGLPHNLALRSGGSVLGWGDNTYGQRTIPTGLSNAVAIAAGSRHSLALRSDGSMLGWGDNTYGQGTIPNGLEQRGGHRSRKLPQPRSPGGWFGRRLGTEQFQASEHSARLEQHSSHCGGELQ